EPEAAAAIADFDHALRLGPPGCVIKHFAIVGVAKPIDHSIKKMGAHDNEYAAAACLSIEEVAREWRPTAQSALLIVEAPDIAEISVVQKSFQQIALIPKTRVVADRDDDAVFVGSAVNLLRVFDC